MDLEEADRALVEGREEIDDQLAEGIRDPDADTDAARSVRAVLDEGYMPVFGYDE